MAKRNNDDDKNERKNRRFSIDDDAFASDDDDGFMNDEDFDTFINPSQKKKLGITKLKDVASSQAKVPSAIPVQHPNGGSGTPTK